MSMAEHDISSNMKLNTVIQEQEISLTFFNTVCILQRIQCHVYNKPSVKEYTDTVCRQ